MLRSCLGIAVLAAGLGCASSGTYTPSTFNAPSIPRPGNAQISGGYGRPGFHLNGGYAWTEGLQLRASGQGSSRTDGYYRGVGLGGALVATHPLEAREHPLSLQGGGALELGAAAARGSREEAGQEERVYFSGTAYRVALQGEFGLWSRYFTAAAVLRTTFVHLAHDARSAAAGDSAEWLFLEPGLVVRAGFRIVKLEAQIGTSVALAESGDIGSHERLIAALGLTVDLE